MSHPKTVLVVDDDDCLRDTICELLSDEGFGAVGAANGIRALEYLRSSPPPCVILLDLNMPEMSGWDFRRAQKSDPALACICTAVMTAGQTLRRWPVDADHVLEKPMQLQKLLALVAECCSGATP
jgi:CheY-like chemotaxis protein